MEACKEIADNILKNIRKVIIGKDQVIRHILACWFGGGHILLEDVPGTGKTMLARAIAKSTQMMFKRVQFTPDLLPSDILGSSIYNQSTNAFEFYRGPLFTTVFLGDEINRATPRTQSALLECMAEGQITAEGTTYPLPSAFFVMATQNPVEQQGTFPLPEAQMDRFMMKLSMGYPSLEEEIAMLKSQKGSHPIGDLGPVESEERVIYARNMVSQVRVSDVVYKYAAKIVNKTRENPMLRTGVSPRGTLALMRAAQALAMIEGHDFLTPSHLFHLAPIVLAHRLIPTAEARLNGLNGSIILQQTLKEVPVPVEL